MLNSLKAVDDIFSRDTRMKRDQIFTAIALIVVFLWLLVALTGCSWFRRQQAATPEQLAVSGMEAFDDEDYKGALESFSKLKERYPYSRYAILAELKIGDAHFHRKEYPEAVAAYEEFASLHPKNEAIPYVLYQIGACYYAQLMTRDRDQTATNEAINSFERLIKSHPNSSQASKARERIRICRELLAENEIYVARFYYKSKHYKAALARFEGLLSHYNDVISVETRREVEEAIVVCKQKIADIIE
jgi:outer membrane protein assembly factor BamD